MIAHLPAQQPMASAPLADVNESGDDLRFGGHHVGVGVMLTLRRPHAIVSRRASMRTCERAGGRTGRGTE